MHYSSKEGGFAPADFVKRCKDVFQFWVPNKLGYPRVIPEKTQKFELYGYPTQKYPWNSDTNPTQPIPKF
jgi:hypothetical protein